MGALAAAWELTEARRDLQITVYQLGWRLGGKGAASRNMDHSARIEEHGLHLLLGYYHNSFTVIRGAYDELDRPAGALLRTWRDAFEPQLHTTVMERVDGRWKPWHLRFPYKPGAPGDQDGLSGPWDLVSELLPWIVHQVEQSPFTPVGVGGTKLSERILKVGERVLRALIDDKKGGDSSRSVRNIRRLRDFALRLLAGSTATQDGARRLSIVFDLSLTALAGMIDAGVLDRGFDHLDDRDLRAFLRRQGLGEAASSSALLRSVYDIAFAYEDGDPERPRLAAGAGLRGLLLMFYGYRGGFYWKMNAGMGETVFAPIYQALVKRGVRFRFFHRVDELVPDERGIGAVKMTRQARFRGYRPLVRVKGLPCWPAEPDWTQAGDDLRGRDLEAPGEDGVGARQVLRRGRDFDEVVLGIPVGALGVLTRRLAERSEPWATMLGTLRTVPTRSAQLWLSEPLSDLGWDVQGTVVGGFAEPWDSWADFSHLLEREDWRGRRPRSCLYLTASMEDVGPVSAAGEARLVRRLRADTNAWLDRDVRHVWPGAVSRRGFRDELYVASTRHASRLRGQYVRVNTRPSDRYVQGHPGTTSARLPADAPDFDNLFLAGDWVKTGLDLGCLECAAMAGRQAARAILTR